MMQIEKALKSNPNSILSPECDLVVVERCRCMFKMRVARLTDAHWLQEAKTRNFRLEATAFVAEDEAAVATMMAPLVN